MDEKVMTREEAGRYYDAIVGSMPDGIPEDMKTDCRLRHVLLHRSGAVPDGVDEDESFETFFETLINV